MADILAPRSALCDKEFRLTIDDTTFIGHPTLLDADRPGTGHRFARMIQKKRLADLAGDCAIKRGRNVSIASGMSGTGANLLSSPADSLGTRSDIAIINGRQYGETGDLFFVPGSATTTATATSVTADKGAGSGTMTVEHVDEMMASGAIFSPTLPQDSRADIALTENLHGLGLSDVSPSMQSSILRPSAIRGGAKAAANSLPLTMFNLVIAMRPKKSGVGARRRFGNESMSQDIDDVYHQVGMYSFDFSRYNYPTSEVIMDLSCQTHCRTQI